LRRLKNGVIFEVDKDIHIMLVIPMLLRFFAILFAAHPFHVSVCDAYYNEENKTVEVIHKLFFDDFSQALEAFHGQAVNLNDVPTATPIVEQYLTKKFGVVINDKAKAYNIIGYEIDEGSVWVYLEIEKVKRIDEVVVYNTMLTELFDDQENLVHMKVSGKTKSLRLSALKTKGTLQWN